MGDGCPRVCEDTELKKIHHNSDQLAKKQFCSTKLSLYTHIVARDYAILTDSVAQHKYSFLVPGGAL